MTPATPTETPAATPLPVSSGRSLLRAVASPSVTATEGTRSPSTVPESSEQERDEWPLGMIDSVKDVIKYQTQVSQASAASPAPERSKRPRDEEELDPAKRMRVTPQPRENMSLSNSNNKENEVTRISDSMPSTAVDDATTLRAQLARM
jgi:hypothetical protein